MKIETGEVVVIVLQNPREKVLGVVEEISQTGVFVRCIDLNYFDEWVKAINNEEPVLPMQDSFYPMWRIERITRDASTEGIPSMAEQFASRTGREIGEF